MQGGAAAVETRRTEPDRDLAWSLAARAQASLAAIRASSRGRAAAHSTATATRGATASRQDRRTELDGICESLRQTEVFANLDERQLRRLARGCSEQDRTANQLVFRCGDRSDAVYVIREGSVNVLRDQRGKPLRRLARLHAGDIFGELGVLHGVARGASVRTAGTCRLLRVGKQTFLRFLEDNAAAEAKLEALAAHRHCRNAAAALNSRKDARIRIDAPVVLLPAAERRQLTNLEDISQGGLSMTGAPASWLPEEPVNFTLVAGEERLCVIGRVAWRRGETLGIGYTGDIPGHGHQVSRFTRALLESLD